MLSASAVQVAATQFTHWPPPITPTLNVQSARGHGVDRHDLRAIARMAERPSLRRAPAWLGRPVARRSNRAMA